MKVGFRKCFNKQFNKLPVKIQETFSNKLEIFVVNPFSPIFNNHQLHGKLKNMRSINVSGDIRAVYEQIDKGKALFLMIGSHSDLYD